MESPLSYLSQTAEETRAWAANCARLWPTPPPPYPVLVLSGPLGAGKTEFVRGLVRAWGSPDPISSPTYSIVQEYNTSTTPIFHFDFYRLDTEKEVWDLGWEEYLLSGPVIAEWGEKFPASFPPHTWWCSILPQGNGSRSLHLQPPCPPSV